MEIQVETHAQAAVLVYQTLFLELATSGQVAVAAVFGLELTTV
jgi:hypothetical protein